MFRNILREGLCKDGSGEVLSCSFYLLVFLSVLCIDDFNAKNIDIEC